MSAVRKHFGCSNKVLYNSPLIYIKLCYSGAKPLVCSSSVQYVYQNRSEGSYIDVSAWLAL